MGFSAMAIPVQTLPLSKIVVDSNLDLGAYELLAAKVKASEILADYLDELVVSAGLTLGLVSGGIITLQNDLECSGALSGNAFAGFMQRKYTGNAGTEVFQRLFPAIDKAIMTGTTLTNMGLKLRIPDTGIPAANLKFTCWLKSGGAYQASCEIYQNGAGTGSVTATTGIHTLLQECAFSDVVSIAAGDYIEFYCVNANVATTTQLYEVSIIGDITLSGIVNDESNLPLGLS